MYIHVQGIQPQHKVHDGFFFLANRLIILFPGQPAGQFFFLAEGTVNFFFSILLEPPHGSLMVSAVKVSAI